MPKGYILSAHRSPANPEKRDAYAKIYSSNENVFTHR